MRSLLRALLALALFGALSALLPRPARAAGTVTLASREPTEEDGKWKLKMSIDYGSIPQLPHIPMLFSFQPMVLYERALLDKTGDKPVLNKIPLQNQSLINESMDVGFSDASGKIFKVTKFDFVIRRDHGFEAGEYDLKIKREDDGVQMGPTIRLILKGDNPVVDRRAIMFTGDKKKKVDPDKKDDSGDKKADDPAPAGDEKKADDSGGGQTGDDVPKVPPKQGGCGCKLAGDETPARAVPALALAAALALRRRKATRAP
jgi:MYXO-CTERM domain-containing protein